MFEILKLFIIINTYYEFGKLSDYKLYVKQVLSKETSLTNIQNVLVL